MKLHRISDILFRCPDSSQLLKYILCDQSTPETYKLVPLNNDWWPETFSIEDRKVNPYYLDPSERQFSQHFEKLVRKRISRIEIIPTNFPSEIEDEITAIVRLFLDSHHAGKTISHYIANQEMPYVVDRILSILFFDNPLQDLHNTKAIRSDFFRWFKLASSSPSLTKIRDLDTLLNLSLNAGLLGQNLKNKTLVGPYINISRSDLKNQSSSELKHSIENNIGLLLELSSRPTIFNYSSSFLKDISSGACRLTWFTDDFGESFFDLLFIQNSLRLNERLHVCLIPKSIQCDNDASHSDILSIIRLPIFSTLRQYLFENRLSICSKGPIMATANLRKLSPEAARLINEADIVFIKGTNIHELFQGGINKKMYTGFVLTRPFNESEFGLSAINSPPILIKTEPGEYAWWGFEERERRIVKFGSAQLRLCASTATEHEQRKNSVDKAFLLSELNLLKSYETIRKPAYSRAVQQEIEMISRKIERL